ncbi:MAG TPA: 2-C-methyl-D-erythritol 2,4-cyclodiphosphate synthase [Burkholderiales bacterium]|nr:2-C-methyl-D-erythritol 2,4-cyclodiphosphate synthase [Burkholderiales bacterium]
MLRIGQGFDVHALVPERPLILGGVLIPHVMGLKGHSDADVLLHALTDALLGAAALGDIGQHFPDTDDIYRNVDSRILLRKVVFLLNEKGYLVKNVDATIIAQSPKLAPFINDMRLNIAMDMDIGIDCVSVKATTTEYLGFTGRKEGIAAQVIALIDSLGK